MQLTFEDLLAPVEDLGEGDALQSWRWLADEDAQPLLLTALGDLFLIKSDGKVYFLDSYEGSLKPAGLSYEGWKQELSKEHNIDSWFLPNLIAELKRSGLNLSQGQCYSPKIPPVLGGEVEPKNMEVCSWKVHFHIQGQIHEQVKDLPPGTPINGVNIKWVD